LTTTGTSGAATLVGNTLNIPNYAPDLSGYVPTSRTITINGTTQDLTANRTYNVGTVTSVAASGGTGISISGSPITSSGTITITNTAPDQVVALTAGTGISISGTYPNFTITNSSPSLGGTVTSVALSAPTGFAVTGSPITSSGTLALAFASGYSLPTTASQTNWDSAYNNMIVSAAVTGTTTKTLTLTQQDAGTITASWTDDNTDAVTSVFGRTGAVVATEGDYSLTQLSDVTITTPTSGQVLKYNGTTWINDTDANTGTVTSVALSVPTGLSVSGSPITSSGTLAVTFASGYSIPTTASQSNWDTAYTNRITSLTTTGSSGAATLISNTLNIPNYTLAGLGGISLTSLSAFVPLSYNNTTGQFSIDKATTTADGYLSATDWNTFNNKQATITLTTSGTSGAATFTSNTLNIPQYQGALTLTTTGTSGAATLVGNTLNIPQYSGGGGSVSGTTNYIAKFTSSTAVGDSQLFDNGTNVGVGTATAGSKLQINGNAAIGYSTSTAATSNGLAVAGRVGIGTNTPSGGLQISLTDVYNYFSSNSQAATLADVQGLAIGWNRSNGGGETILVYNRGAGSTGGLAFSNNDSGTYNERMRLTSAGSLGILTTTIGSTLQVNGNAAIGYSASTAAPTNGLMVAGNVGVNVTPSAWASGFRAIQIGGRTALFNTDINITTLGNNIFYDGVSYKYITSAAGSSIDLGGNYMTFGTLASGTAGANATGVERARIHTDGIFYIGNGDAVASPNTGIISATGGSGTNIAGAEFRIRGGASTGSGAGGPITFYTAAAGASGTTVRAATEVMRIVSTGDVGIGSTSPSSRGHGGTNRFIEVYNTATSANAQSHLILSTGASANTGSIGSVTFALPNTAGAEKRGAIIQGLIDANSSTSANVRLEFLTANAGSLDTRMLITPAGSVGIGTTTIGSRLQVNGNAAIGYSASTAAPTNGLAVAGDILGAGNVRSSNGTINMAITWQTGPTYGIVGTLSNHDVSVWTNGSQKMLISTGGQVTLNTGANVSAIAQTGYSLTGSNAQSLIDLAGTWNTTGNPTAIKLNITNTASGANADLMELQVGGVNQFVVTKAGNILLGGSITTENPTGGTKKAWKLGSVVVTGSWVIDSSRYVEVEIDGTAYKLALAIAP
jgi:hypothetical protein